MNTITQTILTAIVLDEHVTNEQLVSRTGYDLKRVATHVARLRNRNLLARVNEGQRPVVHKLAGAAQDRAELLAAVIDPDDCTDGSILGNAMRQPSSVFHLGSRA